MAKPPMIEQVMNFAYEKFTKQPGNFLLISGIVGWTASCINQTVAILANKKIPKEQKYFLIPQEVTDGMVNIALFAVFTRSFTRFGERLVETGRMITPDFRKYLEKLNLKDRIGKFDFDIQKLDQIKNPSESEKGICDGYKRFHKGVSFAFSTLGSVISCDFVTPIVRNKIASHRQKEALAKDKPQQETIQPYTAVLPAQNGLNTDKYKQQTNMNISSLNTSMKI